MKGRGTASRIDARYLQHTRAAVAEEICAETAAHRCATTVSIDKAKTVITSNKSPDVPFEQSINPYRGCEHGCIYCYARPSHAYLDLSPGLDFETRLFAKPDAPRLLRAELACKGYRCSPIALGSNTDPYQPIEREWRITRQLIELLLACKHPLSITTKSALVERDLDLLVALAGDQLVKVYISVTSLDNHLAARLEPRASAPARRLRTIRTLTAAGVAVGVLVAPVIPFINDNEMERILGQAAAAGAETADFIMLRLPNEITDLFQDWLQTHEPGKANRVLAAVRTMRGGRLNDPRFHTRMRGQGHYAALIGDRFRLACKRLGFPRRQTRLNCGQFLPPQAGPRQQRLF